MKDLQLPRDIHGGNGQTSTEFGAFFDDPSYRLFKNQLFNYRLRKSRIAPLLKRAPRPILDIGSGISPMAPAGPGTVLADNSFGGMRVMHKEGYRAAVVDIENLGFRSNSFSTIVCSEVLEHIPQDHKALAELSRVLRPGGELIITVPLHQHYWSFDDEVAGHQRRYDPAQLVETLRSYGFEVVSSSKVGSLFERGLTIAAVAVFKRVGASSTRLNRGILRVVTIANMVIADLLRVAAALSPQPLVSIQLFHCRKAQ